MKKILPLILVVLMMVTLCACGGGDVDGKYAMYAVEEDGYCMKVADLGLDGGALEIDGDKFTLSFADETQEGECKVDGKKITLTAEGEDVTGTVEDGIVTIEEDGTKMYFVKDGADTSDIDKNVKSLADILGELEIDE